MKYVKYEKKLIVLLQSIYMKKIRKLHLFISQRLEFLRDQFWSQPYSRFLLMIFLVRFCQE